MGARRKNVRGRGLQGSEAKEGYWREHVSAQATGTLSIRGYCQQHALAEPSFYAWRRELARRDQAQAKAKGRASKRLRAAIVPAPVEFVQLDVRPESIGPGSPIEIVLPGDLRVRVPPGTGRSQLHEVLAALGVLPDAESRRC